jgi:RNA polymerase sigma factor (sigma-70 family)
VQLTAEHRQALHAAAMRYCGYDRAAADDLVQDACERAWQKLPSLRDKSRLFPWLKRILYNCWVNGRRKRFNVILVAEVPDQAIQIEEPSSWKRVTLDDFHDAIEQLAEPFRSAAILHYVDDLSLADIAQRLAIPYPTAATRLHRARKQLTELLDAKLDRDEGGGG